MDGAVLKRIILLFSKPQGLGLGLGVSSTCSHKTEFSFLNGNLMVPAGPFIHLQLQFETKQGPEHTSPRFFAFDEWHSSHPTHGHEGSAKAGAAEQRR